jgi:hypothetical protein
MTQEEKYEKKVEVKEKPPSSTKRVEETEQKVSEEPSTTAQPGRVESVGSKSGEVIGKGLKKVAGVVEEFTAGVSKEMKSSEPPKQEERQAKQTEYLSEETREVPQRKVVEKEKIEKETKEIE